MDHGVKEKTKLLRTKTYFDLIEVSHNFMII